MILLCAVTLLGLTVLVFYHYYLASTFQTTYEHRKGNYAAYLWRPFDSGSLLANLKQRVYPKHRKLPIFRPLEEYVPEQENYREPELKTPQSLFDQSHSMVSISRSLPNNEASRSQVSAGLHRIQLAGDLS